MGEVRLGPTSQVSTHVALDHQTYSALAQHTQITWTAVLKCDEPSRVGRWRLGYITYQSNIHIWTTRPASYKKSKHWFFEKNIGMFRPNFDPFIGIWGSPDQNKNESLHKTDCCNVLSDWWLEAHSAI